MLVTSCSRPPCYYKWQSQDLAPKALKDLLQNVAFCTSPAVFPIFPCSQRLASWCLSFPLDAVVGALWLNQAVTHFQLHHDCFILFLTGTLFLSSQL